MATETKKAFYEELLEVLKKDTQERFFADNGDLLRNTLYECVIKMDSDLIKLLLSNQRIKQKYFTKVDDILVFDKIGFGWAINNKLFLNDSYTRFKNKIGLVDSHEQFISSKNDVVLSFPYKDCILEGGQTKEDQKRGEIFYNETLAPDDIDRLLAPKVFTNAKRYTKDGEEEITAFNDDDNLLIKSNNLLALSSILKRYEGKVKCIYIDPPYNTGSDSFKYNDNFNHSSWLVFMKNRLILAKKLLKEDGVIFVQCDDNEQAYLKVLMDEIFTIDNFVKTIHVQMSIVQGQKVKAAKDGNIVKNGEYIHVYSMNNIKKIGITPLFIPVEYDTHYSIYTDDTGKESGLINFCLSNEKIKKLLLVSGIAKETSTDVKFKIDDLKNAYSLIKEFREFIHENASNIVRTHTMLEIDTGIPKNQLVQNTTYKYTHQNGKKYLYGIDSKGILKQRLLLSEKIKVCDDFYSTYGISSIQGDWWSGYHLDMGNISKEGEVQLENGKKPERLIKNILKFSTTKNDIFLDFHIGSGTTCAVAHKMGRKWIGIEQLDYCENDSLIRLKNVINGEQTGISKAVDWQGGGSFVYCELKELNQKYINEIMQASENDLTKLYNKIINSEFISYKVDVQSLNDNISDFEELSTDDKKKFLLEVLDKNMLYVNYCDIEDNDFAITEKDKAFTKSFYEGV